MVRHAIGAGPLYLRFSSDIQRYLKTNVLLVNHVSSDESCSDVSDTEVNTNQNIPMNTDEGSKRHTGSLSASSKAITSVTLSATQQTVPTLFKKMESEKSREAKVSCPMCHGLFGKTQIGIHADMCAETETAYESAYDSAYDNVFADSNDILSFDEELLNPVIDPKDATENIHYTPATRMDDANFISL